ncbi:hypothetical protein B0H11DRAFT_1980906 [Mycena galericulata]|nr:hypothetical protein B0H11DRAFT_1980906 [Mycena galericulata]
MPPKKRTRTNAPPATSTVPAMGSRAAERPRQNSSTGLLVMPVELLHLIASHFGRSVEVPYVELRTAGENPHLPSEYLYRLIALRAVSQTCNQLRLVFLPILWECMDICVQSPKGSVFYKALGELLKRTSEGLASEPELLSHIETVNVILTRYSSAEVLPPFARCLSLMPNMHTVQIIHAHTAMTTHLKNGFENTSISSVRKIILPSWAHEVLRCCPEVTHVICNGGDGSKLISAIAKSCEKVEMIEGISCNDKIMKRILKAAPNLKEIELHHEPDKETIIALAGFKKLCTITLTHHITQQALDSGTYTTAQSKDLQECVEAAKILLQKQRSVGVPQLMVLHTVPAVPGRFGVSARPAVTVI